MSVVRKTLSFTASEVKTNVLTGLVEEFLQRPSLIVVWGTQIVVAKHDLDLQIGQVSIGKDVVPNVKALGVLAKNEDELFRTVGMQGQRIQLRARELLAAVGTNSLTFMVEIAELA